MNARIEGQRLPDLDALRGIAYVAVTLGHEGVTVPVFSLGQAGVGVFFVLSSLLITGILLDIRSRCEARGAAITAFYIRRFLRLAPLLFVVTGLSVFVGLKPFPETWAWCVLWVSNIRQFLYGWDGYGSNLWTLAIEEQFYLVWPWVVLFFPLKHLARLLAVLFFVPIILRYVVAGMLQIGAERAGDPNLLPFAQLDTLAVGAMLALHRRDGSFGILVKWCDPLLAAAATVCGTLWWFGTAAYVRETMQAIVFGAVVWKFVRGIGPGWARFLLVNPVLDRIGKISYGAYVLQGVIAGWFYWWMWSAPIPGYRVLARLGVDWSRFDSPGFTVTILVVLNLLFAEISFRYFEAPINSLKTRFPYCRGESDLLKPAGQRID